MDFDWSQNNPVQCSRRITTFPFYFFFNFNYFCPVGISNLSAKTSFVPHDTAPAQSLVLHLSRSLRKSRHVDYEVRCAVRYLVGIYVCHDSLLLGSQLIRIRLELTTGNSRESSLKHSTLPNIKFSILNFTISPLGRADVWFEVIANFDIK